MAGLRAYASGADTSSNSKDIFTALVHIPARNRVEKATDLYKIYSGLRKAWAQAAMAGLDKLNDLARKLNDKPLECAVFDMRADYYSVNSGFNGLSLAWYQKAIDFAIANKLAYETGLYLHHMGLYYKTFKHNAEACRYFLKAQSVFSKIGYDKVPGIYMYLSQMGDFYYSLGDYENARINLLDALRYTLKDQHFKINILNTIGLIFRNSRQFPQAINYFDSTISLAKAQRDTVWEGIASGNKGSVYFLEEQYQRALPYIRMDYAISMKHGEPENGTIALLRLIKINIDGNSLHEAKQQLQAAANFLENSKNDELSISSDYYDLKSQLYEKLGHAAESIIYRKKYEQDKDSLIKRNNIAAVERVKLRYEIDKHNDEVTQLKTDAKIQSVKIKAAVVVLVLLMGISLLLYYNQRLKSKKDKELLLAEKRRMDEELRNAETALNNFTENLRQKNMLIEKFKSEVENLKLLSANNANAGRLEELLQAHIMTDESWQDFRKLFSQVYPGFFVNLSRDQPLLSSADIRMLALIKLGLSNSEMAGMLGITVDGIQKAKQRLRKKMDVNAVTRVGDDLEMG